MSLGTVFLIVALVNTVALGLAFCVLALLIAQRLLHG
jgi:hypothetical protein